MRLGIVPIVFFVWRRVTCLGSSLVKAYPIQVHSLSLSTTMEAADIKAGWRPEAAPARARPTPPFDLSKSFFQSCPEP